MDNDVKNQRTREQQNRGSVRNNRGYSIPLDYEQLSFRFRNKM